MVDTLPPAHPSAPYISRLDRLLQVYEEIVANMTKPLGITIEASTDQAELIYITSVGQQVGRHWWTRVSSHVCLNLVLLSATATVCV